MEVRITLKVKMYKETIEKVIKEANEKANKPKLFLLKSYLSILGFFRTLKYKKNHSKQYGTNNNIK